MRRPWQIWLAYYLGLAGVAAAFAWLTIKALELDRAELMARHEAELEEDISRALWRLDTLLTPLLAEEAARPEYVYRPVVAVQPAEFAAAPAPPHQELSPLLARPPAYVLLHFELYPDGRITSPQCPTGDDRAFALARGASEAAMRAAGERLQSLQRVLSHAALLTQLPQQTLPLEVPESPALAENTPPGAAGPAVIANIYDDLSQQLKQQEELAEAAQAAEPRDSTPPAQEQAAAGGASSPMSAASSGTLPGVESGRLLRSQSRAGNDLVNREAVLQTYAQKAVAEQRSNTKSAPATRRAVEGVSRPLWCEGRLLLARRVQVGSELVIQGCWLDWPRLQARLVEEVEDLLPEVELTPISSLRPIKLSRLLATLPVQLTVPPPELPAAGWSPIRASLAAAWACLVMTALAAAMTLHSVLALSERRGAFVAAVTHELRTPLTTFRMYAEMLAQGMVTDEAQRQKYLETLRVEADRLSHLVENVLQYARLERGGNGQRRERVTLERLLDRCRSRLVDRAAQAGLSLAVEVAHGAQAIELKTDAAAVEQILFNLVDNACKYAAAGPDKRLHLVLAGAPKEVQIAIRDHGPGISAEGRKKLFRPFSKSVDEAANSAPGVGLGLALSQRLAADLGGRLELHTPEDGGAAFVLTLPRETAEA